MLETKGAALVAYGVTAPLVPEVLPSDDALAPCTIREPVFTVAQRMAQQRGAAQGALIDSCPAAWSHWPSPHGPLTVGIDGGYVRAQPKPGWVAVIAGNRLLAFTRGEASAPPVSSQGLAFVQTDDQQPTRRLFEGLQAPGHQRNQPITCWSDGGDTGHELQLSLHPHAEHRRAWFHVALRLTVLQPTATGVPDQTREEEVDSPRREPVVRA